MVLSTYLKFLVPLFKHAFKYNSKKYLKKQQHIIKIFKIYKAISLARNNIWNEKISEHSILEIKSRKTF